jgi:hypothetical protein
MERKRRGKRKFETEFIDLLFTLSVDCSKKPVGGPHFLFSSLFV